MEEKATNFIRDIIDEDINNKNYTKVHTRFPPEPNGYLHIGHAQAICLNYGLARDYNGLFNLRFDDTNPAKEDIEYVESIEEDIRWLGADWEDRLYFASDYFQQLYEFAIQLIKEGKAYVDSCTSIQIRSMKGTPSEEGKNSPYRSRSIEENLELFIGMKEGKFNDGAHVLRAKIDMAHPNIQMRDPVIYRIKRATHHRTGDKWCIYPMYDYAHPISDWIEGITYSICTLEFEIHRPLYDWFLIELHLKQEGGKPRQIEFARLNLNYTVLSKRKLLELVMGGYVSGWDDPRMPTISGLRRRGYTPESIRDFAERVGVAKRDAIRDIASLEYSIKDDLNKKALRVMAVLKPLKIVITNYPDGKVEQLDAENNPEDPSMGKRILPFTKNIYIEQDDFREIPPKKYHRLYPGNEVRLKNAYIIKCNAIIKNEKGEIIELHCTYDPETKSGSQTSRSVKGTIHWVTEEHALKAQVRLYDRLFTVPEPENPEPDENLGDENEIEESPSPSGRAGEGLWKSYLNPNSVEILNECLIEPNLANAKPGDKFQFIRLGYFCVDPLTTKELLVFNRTVPLRDTWAKIEKKEVRS